MKYSFFLITICCFFYNCISKPSNETNTPSERDVITKSDILPEIFTQDSGYIIKRDGIKFLLHYNLTDSTNQNLFSEYENETDSIAKYYKDKNNGNYMMIIQRYDNLHDWIILYVDAKNQTIEQDSIYGGGIYQCCWRYIEGNIGFGKIGDYYYAKSCGTGSGYCASALYVFKKINESQNYITENAWALGITDTTKKWVEEYYAAYQNLDSEIKVTKDGLRFKYTYEQGILEEVNDSISKSIPKETKTFNVDYTLINNHWVAKDSTMLKSIGLPF
ncbi:MAG: hypothetical protein E6767_09175 [Dysgonomonas sp.]|nr:hypothetical protein [Dysgonomonas sp.]